MWQDERRGARQSRESRGQSHGRSWLLVIAAAVGCGRAPLPSTRTDARIVDVRGAAEVDLEADAGGVTGGDLAADAAWDVPATASSDVGFDTPSTCSLDGTCDGAVDCRQYPSGTVCGPPSCQGDILTTAGLCDGAGACVAEVRLSCAPFLCDSRTGTCFSSCTSDAQCSGGRPCTRGSCASYGGTPCSENAECESGFCSYGACCDRACNGPCETCGHAGSTGTCTPVAAGALDPHGICPSETASSCGGTGLCDGKGACLLYPKATVCAPASCSDGVLTPVSLCDGAGMCTTGPKLSCAPLGCAASGDTCSRGCPGGDAICTLGYYCTGDEQCVAKKTDGACVGDHECLSNHCANQVCCDSACDGPCVSCNQQGSVGQCRPSSNCTTQE